MQKSSQRFSVAILLIAASLLMFEIALVRIISVVFIANIGFFAITITLFGVAVGGLVVYIRYQKFLREQLEPRLAIYSLWYAVLLFLFIAIFFFIPFNHTSGGGLIFVIFLATPALIVGNIVLVAAFTMRSTEIQRLYFYDLMGAGIGVILAVIGLQLLGGPNVVLMAAVLACIAVFFFVPQRNIQRRAGVALLALIIIIAANTTWQIFSLYRTQKNIGLVFSKWNSFSHIAMYDPPKGTADDANPFARKKRVLIDGNAETSILPFNGDFTPLADLKTSVTSAVFAITKPGHALIIGPGGGMDVLSALMYGHRVQGVEINPIIVNDLMRGSMKEFSGNLYDREDVSIKIAEGRSYLERTHETYDTIHLPLVDTWANTVSGNLSLVESYLYTVEAFHSYLTHLNPDGILSFKRFAYDGPRLVSLFLAAAPEVGMTDPERHIAVISYDAGHGEQINQYLFRRSAFTRTDIDALEAFAHNGVQLSVPYSPFSTTKNIYTELLATQDKKAFYAAQPLNITPVYDQKPFYFFHTRLSDLFGSKAFSGVDGGLTLVFLLALFLSIVIISIPFRFLPAVRSQTKKHIAVPALWYFASIGLAFLLLEITFIQRFILYLEQPLYSYSVVLAALLVFAGIGSRFSEGSSPTRLRSYIVPSVLLTVYTAAIVLFLQPILIASIAWSLAIKIVVSILLTMPIALCMGFFLPLGVRLLTHVERPDLIPWCWAVNGAFSVVASVLAIVLGIITGLNVVMLIAAGIYLTLPLCVALIKRAQPAQAEHTAI